AEVVDGGPADVAALQNADRLVYGGALPHVFVKQRQHLVLALGEVLLCIVATLLEEHDVASRFGQLLGDHRAAVAGPDDAYLGGQGQIAANAITGRNHVGSTRRGRTTRGPW